MLPEVRILAGPARCGKTGQLLVEYRRALATGPLGCALWLSPTHRAAAEVRAALLDSTLGGCFQPQCLTFDQFARRVLDASSLAIRNLPVPLVRHFVNQLIRQALERDELRYFRPIAHTRGFLDLVVGAIQEFKRLEIWPEHLAEALGRRPSLKDRELCLLYQRYQQQLTVHHLYDAQGRFWQARALLRAGQRQPIERLSHVFVDGFTDFTRTEHEMLEILARRGAALSITLPLAAGQQRGELFAKTNSTLAQLRRRHPGLLVEHMARRAGARPALDHLERHLFGNPRQVPPVADTAGIEIVAASGVVQEIETLARRIKRLLVGGAEGDPVPPCDILVVFRSLADVGDTVREVFAQFGVPARLGAPIRLARAPAMAALLCWLRLARDDWPFRQLLAMLGHNGFRADWPQRQADARWAAERTIYALQVPSGREELLAGVERLARGDSPQATAARRAQPLLERMAQTLEHLPRRAALGHWRQALVTFAAAAGLLASGDPDAGGPAQQAIDRAAWDALLAALASQERLDAWREEPPAEFSLAEFCDYLSDLLRCELLPHASDESGRVRVLSAEQARNLSAPYVFLAGLSEKAFPAAAGEDCVLGEAETSALIRAGLPLVSHADRPRFEMLLFYEVVTRATRQLVLSYPALDGRAQPLSPSPFLTELEQAFGAAGIPRTMVNDLSRVPASDEVLSPRELRLRGVSRALEGEMHLLAGLCRHPPTRTAASALLLGFEASRGRQQPSTFGPFEGMLASAAAGELLGRQFGPEHCWSPSQLEQYAYCPFQFWLASVLRLAPLEELEFAADHRGRGQMLHWLLSSLHRQLEVGQRTPGRQSEAEFCAASAALVAQYVGQSAGRGALGRGLLAIDAGRVSAWLAAYRGQHLRYDAAWAAWPSPLLPTHFEVAFGPRKHRAESGDDPEETLDPLSSEEPFELQCRGETIRFAGRIDRIDLGQRGGQTVFNIVDYKSGKPSKRTSLKSVLEGQSLQLPLYALAAQRLLAAQGAVPYRAAYWHLAGEGYREQDAVKFHLDAGGSLELAPEWEHLEQHLRVRVKSLVEGIRRGQFPMYSSDEECTSRCDYRTVCRVHQARVLDKAWQPPDEEPA